MSQDLIRALDGAFTLIPARFDTALVRLNLCTSGLQESKGIHRWQVIDLKRPNIKGPARGLWQFERGGGVRGVMAHKATAALAAEACRRAGVPFDANSVWLAFETNDALAAAFARLLLLTDPRPLTSDPVQGWNTYLWCWRPGAYSRGTPAAREALRKKWHENWQRAEALSR